MKAITTITNSFEKSISANIEIMESVNGRRKVVDTDTYEILFDIVGDAALIEKGNLVIFEQKDGDSTFLSVYDVKNKKVLCDRWQVIKSDKGVYLLYDFVVGTTSYHILDTNNFKESFFKNGFYTGDLIGRVNDEPVFTFGEADAKNAYMSSRGVVFPEENADIKVIGPGLGVEDEDYCYFYAIPTSKRKPLSLMNRDYDRIWADKNDKNVVYCKAERELTAFYVNQGQCFHMITEDYATDMEVADSTKREKGNIYDYVLKVDKGGNFWGLVNVSVNLNTNNSFGAECVCDFKYYDISKNENGDFVTIDANRAGLVRCSKPIRVVDARYDHVTPLNKRYYLLEDNGICDLYDIEKDQIVIDCFEVTHTDGWTLTYKKPSEEGVISFENVNGEIEVKILDKCSSVQPTDTGYYFIHRGWYTGISRYADLIIPCEYKEITVEAFGAEKGINKDRRSVYFSCKNMDGSNELIKYKHGKGTENISTRKFVNYRFFEDFFITGDMDHIYVYNLEHELLLTLSIHDEIKVAKYKDGKPYLYRFGDKMYSYNEDTFKIKEERSDVLFTKVYETDYGYVVVNENNKQSFDFETRWIDALGEDEIEKTLKSNYDGSVRLQMKYPGLKGENK